MNCLQVDIYILVSEYDNQFRKIYRQNLEKIQSDIKECWRTFQWF